MVNTFLYANNAKSALAGSITNTATTANLTSGSGVLFPNPTTGQQFALTFVDAATGLLNEIVYVTARSGDTLTTMVRAQEGTTALNWSAGDLASSLYTAGNASSAAQTNSGSFSATFSGPFVSPLSVTFAYSIIGNIAIISAPLAQAGFNATPVSAANAPAASVPPNLIPIDATNTFGANPAAAFWATAGAVISGSSLQPTSPLGCGIDNAGAMQMNKATNWGSSTGVNGWAAFSFSYRLS